MTKPTFADHFSTTAADYARYRPTYPASLFGWLASIAPVHGRAWDCATGSGQAAVALAAHFAEVIATDASKAQLASATRHPRVRYVCATAEQCGLRDRSIDIVTAAQALHWFDLDAFYREVNRVVVPGGLIAVVSYGVTAIERRIDEVVNELYTDTVGEYWPPERVHVDRGYRDLEFPFAALDAPTFPMTASWTLAELLGYVGTWSAVRRYRSVQGDAGLQRFAERLSTAWGSASGRREVRWPLTVKAGRIADAKA